MTIILRGRAKYDIIITNETRGAEMVINWYMASPKLVINKRPEAYVRKNAYPG